MSQNMAIWDSLSKTDPKHTKGFSRAGGFKGTAIKPIWIIQRLTDYFGPVGRGWGMGEPSFQVVPVLDEVMVYCTVRCWHTQEANGFYGVGGDKVTTKRQSGSFNDDEAFKKAFTDAVGNAFKFVGVGADVHMGQFDDSKYVAMMEAEFSDETEQPKQARRPKLTGHHKTWDALRTATGELKKALLEAADGGDPMHLDEVLTTHFETVQQLEAEGGDWWSHLEYGIEGLIKQTKERLA